jgi:hypothetical protein
VREILVNPNVAAPARSPLQRTLIASALVVTSPLWLSLTLV